MPNVIAALTIRGKKLILETLRARSESEDAASRVSWDALEGSNHARRNMRLRFRGIPRAAPLGRL